MHEFVCARALVTLGRRPKGARRRIRGRTRHTCRAAIHTYFPSSSVQLHSSRLPSIALFLSLLPCPLLLRARFSLAFAQVDDVVIHGVVPTVNMLQGYIVVMTRAIMARAIMEMCGSKIFSLHRSHRDFFNSVQKEMLGYERELASVYCARITQRMAG